MNMFAERDLRNRQEDLAFDRCGQFSVNTDSMIQSAYAERKESLDNIAANSLPQPTERIKYLESINSELSHEVLKLKEEIKMKELQDQVLHAIIDKLINALAKK